jgi:Ca2+-binding RTX toxin-like protein
VSRIAVVLAALAVTGVGAVAAPGAGAAAGCSASRDVAAVTIAGPGQVVIGVGTGGAVLVDGVPCGSATVGATDRLRVVGDDGGQSVRIGGAFGRTRVAVGLGANDDVVEAADHRGRGLRLAGGAGSDSLNGGRGDDRIAGGAGDDSCEGGPGRDRLRSCMPAFDARAAAIDDRLQRRMTGRSWHRGCPVPLAQLRVIALRHWGFDRDVHEGKLVVHEDEVGDITRAMRSLFSHRFPIRRMRLVDDYAANDRRSMRADNTSAFNCRFVAGRPGTWSQHAYGRAIDVNPVENPYVTSSGFVSPRSGRRFADRSRGAKGMIHRGDRVVRAFRAVGWEWGGAWNGTRDYQHFSANGR